MTTLNDKNQHQLSPRPLTPAEEIILETATKICQDDKRPFTYRDLPFKYGTRRNCIRNLIKRGSVKPVIDSNVTFYWVCEVPEPKHGWPMTRNHTGVLSPAEASFLDVIAQVPLGAPGIHDVRLVFVSPGSYQSALVRFPAGVKERSHDVHLPKIILDSWRHAQVILHRGDRASVFLACTCAPYLNNDKGLSEFLEALSEIKGNIAAILHAIVPPKEEWVVGSWHFGRDSLMEFSGEGINLNVEQAKTVYRAYLKMMGSTRRLRLEKTQILGQKVAAIITSRLEEI